MWGQRICDLGPLYIRAQGPRRGEALPMTCNESPNGLEIQSRTILSSAPQNLEGRNGTPSKSAPKALLEERASTVGRTRGYSVGVVQGKAVTSALNVPTNVLTALMGKGPLTVWQQRTRDRLPLLQLSTLRLTEPYSSVFTTTTNHFKYGLIRQVSAL